MPIIDETTLSNPQAFIWCPEPYTSDLPCRDTFLPLWVADHGVRPCSDDSCAGIKAKIGQQGNINRFLTPVYKEINNYLQVTNAPNIANLVGVQGMDTKVSEIQSALQVFATSSAINSPYSPDDVKALRNGSLLDSASVDPRVIDAKNTVYKWRKISPAGQWLTPKGNGMIEVIPQSRDKTTPKIIQLNVVDDEMADEEFKKHQNTQVNAFTLELGLQPGGEEELPTEYPAQETSTVPNTAESTHTVQSVVSERKPWRVKILFGDVTAEIFENKSEMLVRLKDAEPMWVAINQGSGDKNVTYKGDNPMSLTFIPVWNGLLVTDVPVSAQNWNERATYVLKDRVLDIREEIGTIIKDAGQDAEAPCRFGSNGETLPKDDPQQEDPDDIEAGAQERFDTVLENGGTPEEAVAGYLAYMQSHLDLIDSGAYGSYNNAYSEAYNEATGNGQSVEQAHEAGKEAGKVELNKIKNGSYGVKIATGNIDFGKTLKILFYRCGGAVQFKPVYFTKTLRTQYLHRGQPRRLDTDDSNCSITRSIYAEEEVPCAKLVPVFIPNGNRYTKRQGVRRVPGNDQDPWDSHYCEFDRSVAGLRRPVEFLGHFVYRVEKPDDPDCYTYKIFRDEGCLTPSDVQTPRVRSVQINRTLDGESGSITWDRFGPGGRAFRPPQNVGAISIGIAGGENTVPGVIFTGIGMGNHATASESEDGVTIPLFGKDIKMSQQGGGIVLMNMPYFDAYDHRKVIEYLANYAQVPFENNSVVAYKLPAGDFTTNAVIDFKSGTYVWDAIAEIQKHAVTIAFFDRFGTLQYYDAGQTTGNNWDYPLTQVETYNDATDLTVMRDNIFVVGLVKESETLPVEGVRNRLDVDNQNVHLEMIPIRPETSPTFPWDKMLFYPLPGIVERPQLQKEAARLAGLLNRPRATGSVTIPGNAEVDLLDTFNTSWQVVGVSHSIDLTSKRWTTTLSLEYRVQSTPVSITGPEGPEEPEQVDNDQGDQVDPMGRNDPWFLNDPGNLGTVFQRRENETDSGA